MAPRGDLVFFKLAGMEVSCDWYLEINWQGLFEYKKTIDKKIEIRNVFTF